MLPHLSNLSQTNIVITTLVVTFASAFGLYLYHKSKKHVMPKIWKPIGKVTNLYLYPLKSGRRIPLKRADCTDLGFKVCVEDEKVFQLRDRSLVIYGEDNNEFKTARTYPNMILIEVSVHGEEYLQFDAPGMRSLFVEIPRETKHKVAEVMMRGEKIRALDCGDEAANWLSRYLLENDKGFRLAYFDPNCRRDIQTSYSKFLKVYPNLSSDSMGMFTDLASCLLINEASVRDMNSRMTDKSITHENFRPNIVIDGPEVAAYSEDKWDWIKIGDVVFRNVLPCTRCILTTINPENGTRNLNREPLNTLEKYRVFSQPEKKALWPRSPVMGANLELKNLGQVKVKDTVYIGVN